MAHRKGRPGSPKGQPKPPKRRLDKEFATRLQAAMDRHNPPLTNAELARRASVERATIGDYLGGEKTSMDALVLFQVADALDVSARWLLTGDGLPGRGRPLATDQHRTLDLYSALPPHWRTHWLDHGEAIRRNHATDAC